MYPFEFLPNRSINKSGNGILLVRLLVQTWVGTSYRSKSMAQYTVTGLTLAP
jgi:hypothetical protein